MNGPIDPLQRLHEEMKGRDLLNGPNQDFKTFSSSLNTPENRQRLYGVLKDEGWQVHDFSEFESIFFPKKKEATQPSGTALSGSSSSQTSVPVPTVEEPSSNGEQQVAASPPNSLLRQFSSVGGPQPSATPSRLDTPTILSGEEDPLDVGGNMRRQTEVDYDFKEKRSYQNPKTKANRDFQNIGMYAQAASKQVKDADAVLQTRYGKDWQNEMQKAMQMAGAKPENPADIEYLNESNDFVQKVQSDPAFDTWMKGQRAINKAQQNYADYSKENRAYAEYNAMELLRNTMAQNPTTALSNWAMGKGVKVAAGIASLPRTLIGAAASDARQGAALKNTAAYRWAQDMGDWADKAIGDAAQLLPTGPGTNRPLWEKVARFEGVDVAVDDRGMPVRTMKNGKDFQPDQDFEQRFIQSGAAGSAKSTFTGIKNAGFKLADVVSDLYLMRSMGGGTTAGTTAVAFGLAHQDAYNTAINELNLSGDDASAYALISAGLSGLIEATIGEAETKPLKMAAAKALGMKEAKALVGKASILDVAKAAWKPYLESVAGENVEELVDNMAQSMNNQMFNAMKGSNLDTDVTPENIAETIVMTTLATSIAGAGDAMRQGGTQMYDNALNVAVQNPEAFNKVLGQLLDGGVVTQEEADFQKGRIEKLAQINAALPAGITEEKRQEAIGLEDKRILLGLQPAASAAQVKAKETADKALESQIIKTITNNEQTQNTAGEPDQQSQDEAGQPDDSGTDNGKIDSPQQRTEGTDQRSENVGQQEVTALDVFTGQYDENPFERLPVNDYVGEARLVPMESRGEAPTLEQAIPQRNTPVSEVQAAYGENTDAMVDDATNIALHAMPANVRNQVSGNPGLLATLQNRISQAIENESWMAENQDTPFVPQIEAIAQDFADEQTGETQDKRLSRRFKPVTVDDHIAAAFAEGVRVRPSDIAGDVADASTGSVQMQYTSKNGTPIDLIAQDVLQAMGNDPDNPVGMNEQDVISAIYNFIDQNPNGPGEHMRNTIAQRELSEMEPDMSSGMPEKPVEESDIRDAVDVESSLTDAEVDELEAFIDSYGDDMEGLANDWANFDPFEDTPANIAIRNLSPNIFQILDGKINGRQESAGQETVEDVLEDSGEVREQSSAEQAGSGAAERTEQNQENDARREQEELTGVTKPPILPGPIITKNETGGVVTNAEAFADLLSNAGATFDSEQGGWVFTSEQSDAVNEALSTRRTDGGPVVETVTAVVKSSGIGAQVREILASPGAVLHQYRTKRRLAAAATLSERLAIAKAEHQISREREIKATRRMVKRLQDAFPDVKIVTDEVTIERVKEKIGLKGPVLGFEFEGNVYVDLRYAKPDTPIHEMGHLWNSWLKTNDAKTWEKGVKLAKDSDLFEQISVHPAYAGMTEEQLADETLARAIAERGMLLGNSNTVIRFRRWLSDMWSSVQRSLGFQPKFMSLKEFADHQALRMLGDKTMLTETSRRIKMLEKQPVSAAEMKSRLSKAVAMEQSGSTNEQILVTTGWVRSSDGFWRWGIDSSTFGVKIDSGSNASVPVEAVGDVIDWPDLFSTYPDLAKVPISQIGVDPLSPDFVYKVQDTLLEGVRESDTASELAQMAPEEAHVIDGADTTAPRLAVALGSSEYSARLATAKGVVDAEFSKDGLKGADEKSAEIAEALNIDINHVKRLFEQSARLAAGRVVLTRADVNMAEPTMKEKLAKRFAYQKEDVKKWLQRKFTTGGLMPKGIFNADQVRLGRIASRIKDGEYILADLEAAMKAEYGNPTVAQWRMVDNIIRGEGDWQLLPAGVYGPAMALRQFTDSLSRDLVRSGVMDGKVVITVLENAGVQDAEAKLQDWDGVNLQEALGKLPFERSAGEHAAIESFLKSHEGGVGSYLYRSYRMHDDTGWRRTVEIENPRVWNEAKRFLENQMQGYINEVFEKRQEREDKMREKISGIESEIQTMVDGIQGEIDALENTMSEIEATQAERVANQQARNKALDTKYANAAKALRDLKKRSSQAQKMVDIEDAEILLQLDDPDFQHLSVVAKQIVKKRRKIMELEGKIADNQTWGQSKIDQYQQNLQNIEGEMEKILDIEHGPSSQLSRSKLGAKDISILKGRKDIPEPIRELMGEYHDPRVNFAKSMYRMVNLLENQKFLTDLREQFTGVYFIPPGEIRKGFVEISSEGSDTMAPLNGWSAPIEVRDALNNYFGPSAKPRDAWDRLFRNYVKMTAFFKYGKTILSPVTHFRNFVGNVFFMVNNAYNPFTGKSALAFKDAWTNMKNLEDRKYVSRLTELRVLSNGSYIGSIRELLNTMNADSVDQFFEGKLGSGANKFRKGIEDTYQAEDDFYRIMAFETEKARYSKSWYGQPFESLTPAQQDAIEKHAAELVTALMPTYSMIPEIVKDIQKFPLTGTFVAFPAEMFRVTMNQWRQIGRDIADPRTRGIGFQRLIGASIAQIGLTAGLTALGHWMSGIDWEEDKAARRFMFPWQDNGVLVYTDYEPGKEIRFLNLSYTNPYSWMTKPVAAMFLNYGKPWNQKVKEAAWNVVEPFFSPELTAQTLGQLYYNINERTDRPIYNPGLGPFGDWDNTRSFLLWNLQPGVSKLTLDMYSAISGKSINNRVPKELPDVLMGLMGMQVERLNLEKAVTSKMVSHRKEKEYARDVFTDSKFNYKDDPEGLKARFDLATQEYNDALQAAGLSVGAAMEIGVSPITLGKMLKDKGFNTAERGAILNHNKIVPKFEGYNK